jgi:hypothetical protein
VGGPGALGGRWMLGGTLSGTRRYTGAAGIVAAALAGIIYMTPAEFANLQRLSNDARRARLGMPDTCRPGLTAVKMSTKRSGRIAVLVICHKREPPSPLSPPSPSPK